jgi:hypothetical protein
MEAPSPKANPAEFTAAAGSVAFLVCYFLGVDDPAVLAALGTVIGLIPALVTWIVNIVRSP